MLVGIVDSILVSVFAGCASLYVFSRRRLVKSIFKLVFVLLSFAVLPVIAATPDEKAEMQRKLNAEVMSKPFFAEEPEKVEAYIKDAAKKNLKPPEYTGSNWRPGYTCHDLLAYSWLEYRNCSYYHRYHGRYYPYPY
jgi:hypothetical protein